MKKLSKLKLNQLSKADLEARQMNALFGGNCCGCGCHYVDTGGSSFANNGQANDNRGWTSYGSDKACGKANVEITINGTCN